MVGISSSNVTGKLQDIPREDTEDPFREQIGIINRTAVEGVLSERTRPRSEDKKERPKQRGRERKKTGSRDGTGIRRQETSNQILSFST